MSKIRRLSGLSKHSPSHFGQWKRCQNRLCPRIMRSCGQFPAGTVSEFPNRPMCQNKRPGKRLILDNYWRRARYWSKLTTDASLPARFAPSVHYLAPAACSSSPSALYLVPAASATVFSLAITYLFLKKCMTTAAITMDIAATLVLEMNMTSPGVCSPALVKCAR